MESCGSWWGKFAGSISLNINLWSLVLKINPVMIGTGIPLFGNVKLRLNLDLVDIKNIRTVSLNQRIRSSILSNKGEEFKCGWISYYYNIRGVWRWNYRQKDLNRTLHRWIIINDFNRRIRNRPSYNDVFWRNLERILLN